MTNGLINGIAVIGLCSLALPKHRKFVVSVFLVLVVALLLLFAAIATQRGGTAQDLPGATALAGQLGGIIGAMVVPLGWSFWKTRAR